jgi:hypothetical protein
MPGGGLLKNSFREKKYRTTVCGYLSRRPRNATYLRAYER